jgi:hypothetical protein
LGSVGRRGAERERRANPSAYSNMFFPGEGSLVRWKVIKLINFG